MTVNLKYVVKIMELFRHNPRLQLTIRQISKKTEINYSGIYRTVKELIRQDILDYKTFGRSTVISLGKSVRTVGFMAMIESMNGHTKQELLDKIDEHAERIE